MLLGASPTITYRDLNMPYVKDEIRRFSQRYADKLEEHSNILATDRVRNDKTTRKLKKKLPQDL